MRKVVGVSPCDYTFSPVSTAVLISGVLRVLSATLLPRVLFAFCILVYANHAHKFPLPQSPPTSHSQRSVSLPLFHP
jgi:hypothetical protein